MTAVPLDLLEALAATAPKAEDNGHRPTGKGRAFDLDGWLASHPLPIVSSGPWNSGRKWILNPCPWNPEHTNRAAFIVQFPSGAIAAGCLHSGCHGKGWHELRDLVEPGWRATAGPASAGPEHLTDVGNARRLVTRHREDLRYCWPWDRWLAWDGRRWAADESGEAFRRGKETVAAMYVEAGALADEKARAALAKHALRSEADGRIRAMLSLARSEEHIPVLPSQLDGDPWLLNVLNGTLDLRIGQLRPHRREDLLTMLAPVEYDPEARAPTWEVFLERILASQKELVLFMQKAAGYALSGDVREQVLFFLHGPGANGKTTFINAILKTVADYGKVAAPDLLTAKHLEQHPTGLADLRGCRFVASVEIEEGRRLAEVLVKQLTGADRLKARMMRQDFFEFEPTHKIFLVANHKPPVRGTDLAIWRRILLVPFDVVIPKPEQDKTLPAKLEAERAGILAWLVRGCRLWQQEGLEPPAEVMAATQQYRDESDIIRDFLEERCVLDPALWTSSKDLRTAYVAWCEKTGEKAISQKMFGGRLTERGLTDRKGTGGVRGWQGMGLVADGG